MQRSKMEVAVPRAFNYGSMFVIWAYGTLLLVPFFLALIGISLLGLGALSALILIAVLALTAWFGPLSQGNRYIAKRIKGLRPISASAESAYLVQVTLTPRLRKGFRALLEDADDFGFVTFDGEGFSFDGDSVRVAVPRENILEVRRQNVGWRGLFIYGARISVRIKGLGDVECLEFAERSSAFIPESRRITRALLQKFQSIS